MLAGQPLLIEGTGEQFRDFIHVDDIARGLIIGFQSSVRGTVVNLGSGEHYSVKQVANLVSSNQQHVAPRKNDLKGTLADTCRARRLLGFVTRHSFPKEMRDLIDHAKSGKGDFLEPFWEKQGTISAVEKRLPGWTASGTSERGARIKAACVEKPSFLNDLLQDLRR